MDRFSYLHHAMKTLFRYRHRCKYLPVFVTEFNVRRQKLGILSRRLITYTRIFDAMYNLYPFEQLFDSVISF